MRFCKSDIETHGSHYQYDPKPAVNVKVYGYARSTAEVDNFLSPGGDFTPGSESAFRVWLDNLPDADKHLGWAWESAIEQGWDAIKDDAEVIFGHHAKVNSAGRSGGWCIVSGLPDIESWDALELSKWAKFSKWAKQQAAGVPYNMLWYLYHDCFLPEWERTHTLAKGMCE